MIRAFSETLEIEAHGSAMAAGKEARAAACNSEGRGGREKERGAQHKLISDSESTPRVLERRA